MNTSDDKINLKEELNNVEENVSYQFKLNIRNITRAILELLIGSLDEDLIHRLNDGIFYDSPESIDLFDDLGAIFTLDYTNTGRNNKLQFIYRGYN